MACLVQYLSGTVEFVQLGERTVIGSAESCDIRVDDDEVAPHHCTITLIDGDYVVAACGENLLTFVNAEPLGDPVMLREGDMLIVGSSGMGFMPHDAEMLENLDASFRPKPRVVIRPGERNVHDELSAENRRLRQFEAACRALVKCQDVAMVMDVMLIAAEQVGDATYARIKLKHKTGNATEKTRGSAPPVEPTDEPPPSSGVIRVTRSNEKVTTELAIAIMGRGPVAGAMWLRVDGKVRHLEHHLLRTLCDLCAVTLASFAAR